MWRKWGTPQNFFLAFTDELEKQIFTKKVLKWAKKKQNNFNICNVAFKKKINTWRYHYFTPVYQKSWWYDLQFRDAEYDRLKLVVLGYVLPFHDPKNAKNQNFEKMEKFPEISSFYTCVPKSQSYDVWFLRYRQWDRQTEFFDILGHLSPLWRPKNQHFENLKEILGYYTLYYKWQLYDIWFLRYGAQQTKFFWHFGPFFALLPY